MVRPPVIAAPLRRVSGADGEKAKPQLHWLPFYEATRRKQEAYNSAPQHPLMFDCTHPSVDPFLWDVVWDGMARHIIAKTMLSR